MFGIIRRAALQQTRRLENFVSSDRAMLAELALLGRFHASNECLFMKRFHDDVSWSLNQQELKTKLSTGDVSYSRRARQLRAFLSAPWQKPVSLANKLHCTGMVVAHSLRIAGELLARKDARNEAIVRAWHRSRRGTIESLAATSGRAEE
jgi:hypothetical protein